MIAEFVDRRGGGLLMLGGPRAFAEGGYAGTAVADVLPVVLDRGHGAAEGHRDAADGEADARRRRDGRDAAGAHRGGVGREMGVAAGRDGGEPRRRREARRHGAADRHRRVARASGPMLAFQRYGRGKAFAFLPQDSWMWQMHATIPVEDMTHENYWRQLLRWLVDGVPDQVEPRADDRARGARRGRRRSSPNVVDPSFVELNDAAVIARVTGPDGTISDVPMSWDGEHAGEYRASRSPPRRRAGTRRSSRRRAAARRSAARSRTSAPRPATPSTSTRRMHGGHACGASPRTPAAASTTPATSRLAGRRPALHRPRRDDGGGARAVAHADRADAARGPAVRGMGVSTCRRPGVARSSRRRSSSRPAACPPAPWRGRKPWRRRHRSSAGSDERPWSNPPRCDYDGRFAFVRLRYGGSSRPAGSAREPPWAHDYPRADFHFLQILERDDVHAHVSSTRATS